MKYLINLHIIKPNVRQVNRNPVLIGLRGVTTIMQNKDRNTQKILTDLSKSLSQRPLPSDSRLTLRTNFI